MGQWLMEGDVGESSKALMSFYLTSGNSGDCAGYLPSPCDPSDFNRCVQFLEKCVNPSQRLNLIYEIGSTTKNWKKVKDNWLILFKIFQKERKQEKAPELFALMKKIGL